MKRRRLLVTALVFLVATGAVAQQAAVFENVSGKVEIRPPGGAWRTAEEGEQIPLNATVSTGFGSEATLALGRSTVTMKALSRMTVEELVEREGVSQSSTRVNVGRVSARVRSAEGVRTDFQIRGPISTASVRGTGFDFDTVRLFVTENEVELTNLLEQRRTVYEGQSAGTGGYDYPANPERGLISRTGTDTTTGAVSTGGSQARRGGAGGRGLASILVKVEE
ncbi:MAG: hypothetical protein ACLFNX_10605 [Spirochaetaceae bacterium]